MKRNTKKGFTIVELIIVIAVIAVLAAVLIPTFSNLIQKANVAADTTLIKNLNTALAMDTSVSKHVTMTQALEATKENGFDVEKIVARATDNKIVWDSVNDCFAYSEKGKTGLTYIPDSKTDANVEAYQLWTIVKGNNVDDMYSSYIAGTNVTGEITATKGVDVGENKGIAEIIYKGGSNQSVVIRTNGGKLTVEAPNDHVEHYGLAKEIVVTAVSETTYVEHGTVAKMTVAAEAKNVVIKSTAVVVEINNKSKNLNNEGGFIVKLSEGSEKLNSGSIATGDEIYVGNYDQLQGLAYSSTMGNNLDGKTIKLTADINMTGKTWTPFGFRTETGSTNHFTGTIDGQGHKIIGLSNGSYEGSQSQTTYTGITGDDYGFIAYTEGDVVVKNITFENVNINSSTAKTCGVVVGCTQGSDKDKKIVTTSLILENIKVTGSVIAKDKVAGLVGYLKYVGSAKISNCTVDATISATATNTKSYRAGGLIGYVSSAADVTVDKCSYKGNVTANTNNGDSWCGLLTSGFSGGVNMKVRNCTFEGQASTIIRTDASVKYGCKLNGQYVIGVLACDNIEDGIILNNGTFSIDYSADSGKRVYTVTQGNGQQ